MSNYALGLLKDIDIVEIWELDIDVGNLDATVVASICFSGAREAIVKYLKDNENSGNRP